MLQEVKGFMFPGGGGGGGGALTYNGSIGMCGP